MYILSHINPDGDAIGASFGLSALLNIRSTIVFYGTKPIWFDTLVQELQPETNYVWNVPITPQVIDFPIGDYIQRKNTNSKLYDIQFNSDTIQTYHDVIVVDAKSTTRSGLPKYAPVLIIDHHKDEQDTAWINIRAPGIGSTCEVITSLLTGGSPIKIGGDVSQAAPWLMLGMITDTLSLCINVTKETLNRLSFLFDYTNAFSTIQQIINSTKPKHYIHTIRHVLNTYKEINDNTVFAVVDTEDKNQVAAVMETVRKYYPNVFIAYAQNNRWALTARTAGDLAYKVATELGGGGHASAAGAVNCTSPEEIERTIRKHVIQDCV